MLQRESSVTEMNVYLGRGVSDKGELRLGDPEHFRIEFVELNVIARLAVSSQRACAESDCANIAIGSGRKLAKGQSEPSLLAIVSRCNSRCLRLQELKTMVNLP